MQKHRKHLEAAIDALRQSSVFGNDRSYIVMIDTGEGINTGAYGNNAELRALLVTSLINDPNFHDMLDFIRSLPEQLVELGKAIAKMGGDEDATKVLARMVGKMEEMEMISKQKRQN